MTGCATGYDGSPTQSSLTCESTGQWTTPTGCTIKGMFCFLFFSFVYMVSGNQSADRLVGRLSLSLGRGNGPERGQDCFI